MSTLTDRFGVTNQQKADIDGTYPNLRAQATTAADVGSYTQAEVDAIIAGIEGVPAGVITMWSGAITSVPSGWLLCDGLNGTPNLIDRFIVGAGGTYAVGDTGGANSVTLTEAQMPSHSHSGSSGNAGGHSHTASTNSAGYHGHSGSTNTTGNHSHSLETDYSAGASYGVSSAPSGRVYGGIRTGAAGNHSHSLSINGNGSHTHTVSVSSVSDHSHTISIGNAGSDNSHENRPPYYALAYIMKV